jgi:NADH-quinone oxidoreductase subunit J
MIEIVTLLTIIIISALLTVSSRNIVYGAVFLLCMNVSLGILFYILGAPTVALFQLAIFAGAIVVFFVIAIMFTNSGVMKINEEGDDDE